ncbi:MAG: sigma-70 family RNA polymerase sigma factor [Clostridia bacterium]|nr:sigma-70 family RNA polymerase sigma factor [Clostridia bacterium]
MTNEELAISIKGGNSLAIPQLWAQVEKLVYFLCNKLYLRYNGPLTRAGIQIEDLTQESYFAFLDAIEGYEENKGYKFTSYLNYPLLNRIRFLIGGKTQTALNTADSLERSMGDGLILADMVAAPKNGFLPLEDKLYWEQVKNDLDRSMATLGEIQQGVLIGKYYNGLSTNDLSQQYNKPYEYIRGVEYAAFRRLQRDKRLKQCRDEIISRHAFRGSFSMWRDTGYSSTEYTALKLLDEI